MKLIITITLSLFIFVGVANAQREQAKDFQRLVIPGDFPDPSVIRVGKTYYATCSSSEWGPIFALAKSDNLVEWNIVNYSMSDRPKWSKANYWAPELYHDGKKFFIYYTARIEGGPLCVGVATADQAEGPWVDHGPVVCQSAGSIDASCVEDYDGKKYLVWKEDGNSVGKPTPIWAQELSQSGITPLGEKFELFRNDIPWEKNLVEAPFIMKKGDYLYCFYAGAGCCGVGCDYAVGVARSKSIKGKWEKYNQNPILAGNETWKCPGHGTVVSDAKGNDFFVYHAYNVKSTVYVGRQALISELEWDKDGWPKFKSRMDILPSSKQNLPLWKDDFNALTMGWRWPVEHKPQFEILKGSLALNALDFSKKNQVGGVLGQSTLSENYEAVTQINRITKTSTAISCFGDINNAIGLSVNSDSLVLWKVQKNQRSILAKASTPKTDKIQLRIVVHDGGYPTFSYSKDGKSWTAVGKEVDGRYLPPWDRAVRVALVAQGKGTSFFDWFTLSTK